MPSRSGTPSGGMTHSSSPSASPPTSGSPPQVYDEKKNRWVEHRKAQKAAKAKKRTQARGTRAKAKKLPHGLANGNEGHPAGRVMWANVSALTPYAKNPRLHSPEQVEHIARSMTKYKQTVPILVDERGEIIAGHGRVMAAEKLGWKRIAVTVASGWSEEMRRAYRIADNQLTLASSWDDGLLRAEMFELRAGDYDMQLLGFNDAELAGFFDVTEGQTDPEETPEPSPDPYVKRGDLWILGRHRILCGDATDAKDVARLLGGAKPHLMVTDPPYGVDYDPDWRNRADRANGKPYGARAIGLVHNDGLSDWRKAWNLFLGDVVYAWHPPGAKQVDHFAALVATGFDIRMQIIWAKQQFPIGRGNYHVQHEPCWYAVRKGANAHWSGDRTQSTLWQIDKPHKSETGHSTQKPIECMRRPIENNSKAGDAVYDPFVGSGTTIIAAEMTGRKCYALEIDPSYCQMAVERWQKFAGKTAVVKKSPA